MDVIENINKNGKQNGTMTETKVTPLVNTSIDVDVITTDEEFDRLKPAWNDLLNRPKVAAHIFQTFDWQRLWWKYFGGNNKLNILTVWKNDDLIGIAPFYIHSTPVLGLYEYKKMKFIGSSIPNHNATGGFTSYSISDYLDVIIHPDYSDKVVSTFIKFLIRSRRLVDKIELDELSETSSFIKYVLPEIWQRGWKFKKEKKEICPQIELPETVETYLDDLHRKARYELRYSKRAVTEKELFNIYQIQNEIELEFSFEEFVNIHQKRWNKRGYPGIFANDKFQHFLKDISKAFIKANQLKMSVALDNDGQCIAVDFAFRFKDRVYDYQKAFDDETDLAKYSPGRALTYFLIKDAIAGENKYVDLLRGGEKYKLRFANHKTRNWLFKIPGFKKENFKNYLYKVVRMYKNIKESIQREQLLLKIHIKQWGLSRFIPHYCGFLKYRIAKRF